MAVLDYIDESEYQLWQKAKKRDRQEQQRLAGQYYGQQPTPWQQAFLPRQEQAAPDPPQYTPPGPGEPIITTLPTPVASDSRGAEPSQQLANLWQMAQRGGAVLRNVVSQANQAPDWRTMDLGGPKIPDPTIALNQVRARIGDSLEQSMRQLAENNRRGLEQGQVGDVGPFFHATEKPWLRALYGVGDIINPLGPRFRQAVGYEPGYSELLGQATDEGATGLLPEGTPRALAGLAGETLKEMALRDYPGKEHEPKESFAEAWQRWGREKQNPLVEAIVQGANPLYWVAPEKLGQGVIEGVGKVAQGAERGAPLAKRLVPGLSVEDITQRSPEFLRADELAGRLSEIAHRVDEIPSEMFPLQEELRVLEEGAEKIVRPPQNSPLAFWSNDALMELAERERRNPYQSDWFDALDPVAVADFQSSWQATGGTTGRMGNLRQQIGELRAEERALKQESGPLNKEFKLLEKAISSDLPAREYLVQKAAEREARAAKGTLFEQGEQPPGEPPGPIRGTATTQDDSWLPTVKSTAEILEGAYRNDWPRRLADVNSVAGKVMGAIGVPGRDVVSQGRVLRETILSDWESASTGALARLRQLGSSDKLFNVKDNIATLEGGRQVAVSDLLENPTRFNLTTQQRQYAETIRALYDDAKNALLTEGIPVRAREFEEGAGYIGRRVLGKVDELGNIEVAEIVGSQGGRGGKTVGKKAPFEKVRQFETQAEALAEGFRYLPPEETLQAHLLDVGKKIADKRLVDWALERLPHRTAAAPEELMLAKQHALDKYRIVSRLEQALNRAQRGENLPASTISSIGRYYPEHAWLLADLGPGSPGLQKIKEGLGPLRTEAKNAFLEADRAVNKALEKARTPRYGETAVGAPALGGKFFSTEDAQALQMMLDLEQKGKVRTLAEAASWLNALPRLFLTTFDLGGPMIQLQLLAGYRPVEWGKAVAHGLQALVDERGYQEFLATHADTITKWSQQGAIFTPSEFVSAVQPGGVLSRVPAARRVIQPFARSFEGMLNAAKVYGLEATEHMARTPEEMRDLATFWNQLTGTANTARMGISPTQRAVETAVMFAPRYRRAVLGLMVDVSRGGLRGQMAREALGKATLAGLAAYVGLAYALGQEPQLDPRSGGKFLTVEIAGQRVGIGGAYTATVRLLGRMALEPDKAPQLAGQYLRGLASPVVSSGIDVLKREDYAGRPLDTPLKLTKEVIAGNLTPLWAQAVLLEGEEGEGAAVRSLAEFAGLRSFPTSPAERRDAGMDKASREMYGKPSSELDPDEWDALQKARPDVAKLRQEATEKYAEQGSSYHQYRLAYEDLRDEKEAQITALGEDLKVGRISGNLYRQLVGERERDIAGLRDTVLAANPKFKRALDELAAKGEQEPTSQLGRYLDAFYAISKATTDQRTGAVDVEEMMRRREELRGRYSPEIVKRADAYLARNRDPEYSQALREFRQYMAIPKYLTLEPSEVRKADEVDRFIREVSRALGNSRLAQAEAIDKFGDDYALYRLAKKSGTNPERRAFWREHPLLSKFFSDTPGIEEVIERAS